MDSIVRAVITYAFIWLVLRISGKRSMANLSAFDFVLLLIISETTQEMLTDDDHSMTNSLLLILTFFGVDILLSHLKYRFKRVERVLDDLPVVLVDDGKLQKEIMDKERVDVDDIVMAGRELHGLQSLAQIKYAVLEPHGGISVVPAKDQ